MTEPTTTLGDEYPIEQERLRNLLQQYIEIGPAGTLGAVMIKASLAEADAAAVSGDLVRMIRAFQDMKEFKS